MTDHHHIIAESYHGYALRGRYDVGIFLVLVGFFIAGGFFLYYTMHLKDMGALILVVVGIGIMYLGWKMMKWSKRRMRYD